MQVATDVCCIGSVQFGRLSGILPDHELIGDEPIAKASFMVAFGVAARRNSQDLFEVASIGWRVLSELGSHLAGTV
jgi:hypothetical protein